MSLLVVALMPAISCTLIGEFKGNPVFFEDFANNSDNAFTVDGAVTCIFLANKEPLEKIVSPYQTIEVYQTEFFGNMLVIDGIIMLTDYDNSAYHEMIAHVPLIAHPRPKRVLIVGGGDGGTAQQVLKHTEVQEVTLCDIDKEVINISKKYFPQLATSFNDPRLIVVAEDASQYIKTKENYFDVIIVDSTDPIGPGEVLFQKQFYQNIHSALTEHGIAVTQAESMYYHRDLIERLYKQNAQLFAHTKYYYTVIPTYPSGTIGFYFCSKKHDPFEHVNTKRIKALKDLQYYHKGMHWASFELPAFLKNSFN